MSTHAVPPSRLWWLAAGFGVWFSALVILYALHDVGCTFGWSVGTLRSALVLVLLVHLIVIGVMWGALARSDPDPASGASGTFVHEVIVWTLIAAFIATVLTLGPPLLLHRCM